jgi:hypothetical protein
MVWSQIATFLGKEGLKQMGKKAATEAGKKFVKKKAIDFGKKKALEVGQRHWAKAQRQAVRREELGRGTDRKTLQRGYGSPMDIENV